MALTLGMVGLGEGFRTKLINTPKNNNTARLKKTNKKTGRGESLLRGAAIFMDHEIKVSNSGRTISMSCGFISNNGGITLQFGKPCILDSMSLIIGGMGGYLSNKFRTLLNFCWVFSASIPAWKLSQTMR